MIPEFDVKNVNIKLASDKIAHLFSLILILTSFGFYLTEVFRAHNFHIISLLGYACILLLSFFQVISHHISPFKNWKILDSGQLGPLLIFNVSIVVLLLEYIPLFSPFLILLAAIIFITIYYRGLSAYIFSIVVVIGLVVAYTAIHGYPAVPNGDLYPIVTIVLAICFGGLIARAGIIDENVRKEFIRVSQGIEIEREQLSSLVDGITSAVIATDRSGNILFYNKSATKYLILAKNSGESNQPKMVKIFNKKDLPVNIIQLAEAQKDQKIQIKNVYVIDEFRQKFDLSIDISTIKVKGNQDAAGLIVIIRDVTKEKSLEEERDEFIAVTSNELRAPIAAAEGSLSMLLNPKVTRDLDPKVINRLSNAYQNIEYLSNITNQLALLSQAEQEIIRISYEKFDIQKMVNELLSYFEARAKEKGLTLTLNISLGISEIRSSRIYVNEILKNFLSNAIKFTDSGGIIFEVSQASIKDEVIFKVQDSGIGIDTADQEKIFLKYFRAEDFHTRRTPGTGLGLYMSAKLAGYIDGKIWCQSEPGKGSTFFLKIPNIKDHNKESSETISKPVDPHRDNQIEQAITT